MFVKDSTTYIHVYGLSLKIYPCFCNGMALTHSVSEYVFRIMVNLDKWEGGCGLFGNFAYQDDIAFSFQKFRISIKYF